MIDLPNPPLGPAAARAAERAALGYCLAGHPTADPATSAAIEAAGARSLKATSQLRSRDDRLTIAACCTRVYERKTKAGQWMAVLFLEDARSRAEAAVFPRTWADVADAVDEAAATSTPLLLTVGASADGSLVVHTAAPLWPAGAHGGPPAGDSTIGTTLGTTLGTFGTLLLGDFIVVDVETCVGPPLSGTGARDGQEVGPEGGPHQGSLGAGGGAPPGSGAAPLRRQTRAKKPTPGAPGDAAGGGAAAVGAPSDRLDVTRLRAVEVGVALYAARDRSGAATHSGWRGNHTGHGTLPGGATHYLAAAHSALCDPGCPIDADSTAVHGITDADVRGQPTFAQRAAALALVLGAVPHTRLTAATHTGMGADDAAPAGGPPYRPRRTLVTYNGRRFDLPVLAAEFARAGLSPSATPPAVLDPALSVDVYDHVRLRYRGRLDRPASKRLGDQCDFHEVTLARAHRAKDDAAATGQLLLRLLAGGWAP